MEDGHVSFSAGGKCAGLQQKAALKFEYIHKVKKKLMKRAETRSLKYQCVKD